MKDIGTAYLCWCCLGPLGGHRCYLDDIGCGILYFFTGALFGVGCLVDGLCMNNLVDKANAKYYGQGGVSERVIVVQQQSSTAMYTQVPGTPPPGYYPGPQQQVMAPYGAVVPQAGYGSPVGQPQPGYAVPVQQQVVYMGQQGQPVYGAPQQQAYAASPQQMGGYQQAGYAPEPSAPGYGYQQ